MMRRLLRAGIAVVVLAVAVVGTILAVKASNGDFDGDYSLSGYFPRAGEGLEPGSEVVYRGVQVGRVASVALAGTRARVTLLIDPTFEVPAASTATIEPVNLFGAEEVSLSTPASVTGYVARGGTLTRTATSDELGTLFAVAAPLLQKITAESLSSVVGELAQASSGEGPAIKASIGAGADLAAYLDRTLDAQLAALDSFASFTAAVSSDGAPINGLSAQENVALPAFNRDAADYDRVVANLDSFSSQLARLLTDYHPTIDTLLQDGDNPARILIAQQATLGQAIHGAYRYAYKIGAGESTETLPDGSHFVYFDTFVLFTAVNTLVCDLIAPPTPGLSALEPLQQALAGAGTAFTCTSQLAAFDASQTTAGGAAPAASAASAPSATTTPPGALTAATSALGNAVYGIVGQPASTAPSSIGSYVGALVGGV